MTFLVQPLIASLLAALLIVRLLRASFGPPEHLLFGGFVLLGLAYLALFLYPARFLRLQRRRSRPDA